jgi:endonuclease/exonuclease/phosphatase (EEP) superfamily protein YafD
VITAGDFNATRDNVPIRELEAAGYADAAGSAGAGLVRTWPNDLERVPPAVGIDHVLSRGTPPARAVTTVEIPGADHLALVAEF